MSPEEIIERIMTQHWDLAACRCWICVAGREHGLYPNSRYPKKATKDFPFVRVEDPES